MSAFNIKSTVIANRDSGAIKAPVDTIFAKGQVREVMGVQRSSDAGTDLGAAATAIRLISVPSRARLSSLDYAVANVGLGTSAIDIACWYPTTIPQGGGAPASSNNAALISSSAFKANIAGVDTGIEWTDGLGAISTNTLPKRSQPLWQALGLATDPGIDLDLGFVVRTAAALNGYVGLRARFIE